MGFGTELLFAVLLGYLLLGPKRMYSALGQLARAKTELEKVRRNNTSQHTVELNTAPEKSKGSDQHLRPAVAIEEEHS